MRLPRLCCLLLALLLPFCAHAAQAPEWLTPYLSPEAHDWNKRPAVVLFYQTELRFSSADKFVERRTGALLINEQPQLLPHTALPLNYRAEKEKILLLKLWRIAADGKVKTIARADLQDLSSVSTTVRSSQHQFGYDFSQIPAGSIIAWEFELEHSTGPLETFGWAPLQNFPTYRASFKTNAPRDAELSWKRFGPEAGTFEDKGPEGLSWTLEKLRLHNGVHPVGFLPDRVTLALRCVPKADAQGDTRSWEGIAQAAYQLFEGPITPTPEIRAMAEKLVAGRTGRWSRIRALSDFVQHEITYLSQLRETDYLAGFRPQRAADCLKNRFGDCKDKATLFTALMKCIGEESQVVLLCAGNPTQVRADWPSSTFNHAINAIPAGDDAPEVYPIAQHPHLGRLVIVDTTATASELGVLPISDQLGQALLVHPSQGGLFQLPVDNANTQRQYKTCLSIDTAGTATVERIETNSGQPGSLEHHWRDAVAADKLRSTLEARYHETVPAPLKLEFTETWDPDALRHVLTVHFQAEHFLRKASKELYLLTPALTQPLPPLGPWKTEGPGVTMMPYLSVDEEIRIELPANFTVSELPAPAQGRGVAATFSVTLENRGGVLYQHTHYEQPAGLYSKDEYETVRQLRQRWLSSQRRPIVLKGR